MKKLKWNFKLVRLFVTSWIEGFEMGLKEMWYKGIFKERVPLWVCRLIVILLLPLNSLVIIISMIALKFGKRTMWEEILYEAKRSANSE